MNYETTDFAEAAYLYYLGVIRGHEEVDFFAGLAGPIARVYFIFTDRDVCLKDREYMKNPGTMVDVFKFLQAYSTLKDYLNCYVAERRKG